MAEPTFEHDRLIAAVYAWRQRAIHLDKTARRIRAAHGNLRAAEDAERAASDYRFEADVLEAAGSFDEYNRALAARERPYIEQ